MALPTTKWIFPSSVIVACQQAGQEPLGRGANSGLEVAE